MAFRQMCSRWFNGGFVGGVADQGWDLDLRLLDQFGIP